eukprot:m.183169 g.183169  ORF g.183169 m.183169 type:complete len:150 (+) comp39304_c0_seq8:1259-1708(+)
MTYNRTKTRQVSQNFTEGKSHYPETAGGFLTFTWPLHSGTLTFCAGSVVYIVEIRSVNRVWNAQSTITKTTSVESVQENFSEVTEAPFPMKPPSFEVRLEKFAENCSKCRQSRKISLAFFLNETFQNLFAAKLSDQMTMFCQLTETAQL